MFRNIYLSPSSLTIFRRQLLLFSRILILYDIFEQYAAWAVTRGVQGHLSRPLRNAVLCRSTRT